MIVKIITNNTAGTLACREPGLMLLIRSFIKQRLITMLNGESDKILQHYEKV